MTADLGRQLADELAAKASAWAGVIGPGPALDLEQQARAAASRLTLQLTGADDSERAETVIDVMGLLWPDADPEPRWWATPLGQVVAMSLGTEQARSWSQSVAAAALGVHPGTVAQLVARGTIARHPDGGLVPADVVRYGQQRRRRHN